MSFSFAFSQKTLAADFQLTSSDLQAEQAIPDNFYGNRFGCSNKGISPQLEWKNEPSDTGSFAVTLFDESAPTGTGFYHYVLYNIPATTHSINTGDLSSIPAKLPKGAIESTNDGGNPSYFGPCPPDGPHNYIFTVFALKKADLGITPFTNNIPASGLLVSTPAFVRFNMWAQGILGQASFKVTASPRK